MNKFNISIYWIPTFHRKAADQALDTKFTQAIKEEADARAEYDQVQMQKIQEEEEARAA